MTPEDLLYLESAKEIGRRAADAHYSKLYALYLETVPEFLRMTDASLESRPAAFNADTGSFIFYINLGESHADTFAVFEVRTARSLWRFRHFLSQIQVGSLGFGVKQLISRTLPAAILTASEMWHEANNANPQLGSQPALPPALVQ